MSDEITWITEPLNAEVHGYDDKIVGGSYWHWPGKAPPYRPVLHTVATKKTIKEER